MRRKFLLTLLFVVFLGTTVLGCSAASSLKKGWVETSGLSHTNARYNYFDGVERMSFRAGEGDKIQLDVDIQVEEGSLALYLEDPDGNQIWARAFQEDAEESASLNAPQKGRYHLKVEGKAAEGGYEISWDVEG